MKLGAFDIYPVSDGRVRLDGGAMFGVVPKTLWEKCCPADEFNRISLSLTALLIRANGTNILVDTELGPGVTAIVTAGHTRYHQSVKIESEGQIAFFLGDLIPTVSHLPLPYIMGYDLFPIQTLETKRWVLDRALEERWLLLFEHDPAVQAGYVRKDQEGKYFLREETAWQ